MSDIRVCDLHRRLGRLRTEALWVVSKLGEIDGLQSVQYTASANTAIKTKTVTFIVVVELLDSLWRTGSAS